MNHPALGPLAEKRPGLFKHPQFVGLQSAHDRHAGHIFEHRKIHL